MHFVLDALMNLIALVFLSILGVVTGLLIPALFFPAFAPWLERLLPWKDRR